MQVLDEVIYNGKRIQKKQFRAFIYGAEDKRKLVNSYDEFEANLATGIWFASKDKVPAKAKVLRKKPGKAEDSEGFKNIEDVIFPNDEGE